MNLDEFAFFDNLFDCIAIFNEKAEVVYINDSFERFFEISRRRILRDKDLHKVFHLSKASLTPDHLRQISSPTQYQEDVIRVSFKGERRVQYFFSPLAPNRWMISLRDVSLEEKLHAKFQFELDAKMAAIDDLNRNLFENKILLELSDRLLKCPQGVPAIDACLSTIQYALKFIDCSVYAHKVGKETESVSRTLQDSDKTLNKISKASRLWLENLQVPEYVTEPGLIQMLAESELGVAGAKGMWVWPLRTSTSTGWAVFSRDQREWPQLPTLSRLMQGLIGTLSVALEASFLLERSIRDGLTGLYNVTYFKSRLEQEISRAGRSGSPVTLCLLDVDHFKKVNDTRGHAVGDQVLAHIASILKTVVRRSDLVARYGGEEFVILMTDTQLPGALIAAEKVRAAIAGSPIQLKTGEKFSVTASFGVASHTKGESAQHLVVTADRALYKAKGEGRNRVCSGSAEAA